MSDGFNTWRYKLVHWIGFRYYWFITRPVAHARLGFMVNSMMGTAKAYQTEIRQLKKAVMRRNRKVKRLQKQLADYTTTHGE